MGGWEREEGGGWWVREERQGKMEEGGVKDGWEREDGERGKGGG